MRKLTKNEVIELRACKDMDNGQMEFFDRAARMYADDPEALAKMDKLRKMRLNIKEMADKDASSVRSWEMSMTMYYEHVDELLEEMGYTGKPVEEKKADLIDVLKDFFSHRD